MCHWGTPTTFIHYLSQDSVGQPGPFPVSYVSRSFLDRVISTWQNWKLGNMRLWLQINWVYLLVLSGQVGVRQHDSHGLKEFAPDKTENLTLYTLIQFIPILEWHSSTNGAWQTSKQLWEDQWFISFFYNYFFHIIFIYFWLILN